MTVYNPNQGGGISNLIVTDGVTTVNPTSEITFVGATVTDLGGGNAEVTITGGGGSQTPWLSNIDGGAYNLTDVSAIAVNGTATSFEFDGLGTLDVGLYVHSGNELLINQVLGQHTDTNIIGPSTIFNRSEGTEASPTAVQTNDYLGTILFEGYDGTRYYPGTYIQAMVTDGGGGVVPTGNMGSQLNFYTVANGTASPVLALTIDQDQSLVYPLGATAGYVLTSDSVGRATWQPSSGGSTWIRTLSSDTVTYNQAPLASTDRILIGSTVDDLTTALQVSGIISASTATFLSYDGYKASLATYGDSAGYFQNSEGTISTKLARSLYGISSSVSSSGQVAGYFSDGSHYASLADGTEALYVSGPSLFNYSSGGSASVAIGNPSYSYGLLVDGDVGFAVETTNYIKFSAVSAEANGAQADFVWSYSTPFEVRINDYNDGYALNVNGKSNFTDSTGTYNAQLSDNVGDFAGRFTYGSLSSPSTDAYLGSLVGGKIASIAGFLNEGDAGGYFADQISSPNHMAMLAANSDFITGHRAAGSFYTNQGSGAVVSLGMYDGAEAYAIYAEGEVEMEAQDGTTYAYINQGNYYPALSTFRYGGTSYSAQLSVNNDFITGYPASATFQNGSGGQAVSLATYAGHSLEAVGPAIFNQASPDGDASIETGVGATPLTYAFKAHGTSYFGGLINPQQQTTPDGSTIPYPISGSNYLYFKSDNNLYMMDSSGTETQVNGGGGGGPWTLDTNGTMFSSDTGLSNPAGPTNSFITGNQAGNGAYNASYSNFFGNQAGNGAYNAYYSNFFGAGAGYGATDAAYSIFLGTNAGNVNYTNDSTFVNNLIIDQGIISAESPRLTAADIQANALLYGTFADTAAGQQLTVNGQLNANAGGATYAINATGQSFFNGIIAQSQQSTPNVYPASGSDALYFKSDNNLYMMDSSGTETQVNGGGGGGMAIGGSITSATAGSVLYAGASGVLAQDNSNLYYDYTNHRLGLGTNSPSDELHVVAPGIGTGIRVSGTSGHSPGLFLFNGTTQVGNFLVALNTGDGFLNAAVDDLIFKQSTAHAIIFGTDNVEGMRLSSANKLGIGTISPSYFLDVFSTGNGDNARIGGSGNNASLILQNTGTGGVAWEINSTNNSAGVGGGRFTIDNSSTTLLTIVSATGNVGIGKTSPGSKLSIVGLPTSSSGLSSGDIWLNSNVLTIVP